MCGAAVTALFFCSHLLFRLLLGAISFFFGFKIAFLFGGILMKIAAIHLVDVGTLCLTFHNSLLF